jgi:hypothetical protein
MESKKNCVEACPQKSGKTGTPNKVKNKIFSEKNSKRQY